MLKEALASADVVAAQLADTSHIEALAVKLAEQPRHVALTVARGSSDHAASYFASLTMSRIGVPVASLPMSVATLAAGAVACLRATRLRVLAVGQEPRSGRHDAGVARSGRVHCRGGQCRRTRRWPTPANGICRCSPGRTERRGDQELYRDAVAVGDRHRARPARHGIAQRAQDAAGRVACSGQARLDEGRR